jgi:hypothetical protein
VLVEEEEEEEEENVLLFDLGLSSLRRTLVGVERGEE